MTARPDSPATSDEDRLERVETRIAYQERALQELSDVVYRQELRIDGLESLVSQLREQIEELAEALPATPPDDEPPPHY